jgi:cell division transport system permease protein
MMEQTRPGHIIPPEAAPLRNLIVTMAVMSYLACLAIGALILINRAVDGWTHGLSSEVTVQLRQIQKIELVPELEKTLALLRATPGVISVDALSEEAGLKLLEPWLGSANLKDLPVPRLIRVAINEDSPPDFAALDKNLNETIKGASLDTHRRWVSELTRMAHTLSLLSYVILTLISLSAMAMVIFAARAVLDANQEVVDILHLVGAKDGFIARQIDRRFMLSGLTAGFIGVALALTTFFLLAISGTADSNSVASSSYHLLYAADGSSLWNYLILLCVPVIATIIALLSARLTLMRMLKTQP